MKKIEVYKISDGRMFEDKNKAIIAQAEINLSNAIDAIFKKHDLMEHISEEYRDVILKEQDVFLDILKASKDARN